MDKYFAKRSMIETYVSIIDRQEINNKMRSIKDNMIALRDC